jgi:hypothetical protein
MTPLAHHLHSLNGAGRPFEGNVQGFGAGPTIAGLKDHIAKLAVPKPAEPSGFLAGLLSISDQLRASTESTIVFPPALLWHGDEPVIWPRTITLIQGQTGSHKSRVAEHFGSAILKEGPNGRQGDSLDISFRPVEGIKYRLLYIDTERNLPDQLPFAMQSLKQRAGYGFKDHPAELFYTSLVNIPRKQRFAALVAFLADHRSKFSGHIIVILDVLSDCVSDFNDVEASLELMDSLNVAVNKQDVSFLAVLHENPGTGAAKARGHLGTEASNKASTILQVSFIKEKGVAPGLIQLLYLKRRYAAGGCAFFATYDPEAKGLVRANPDLVATMEKAPQAGPKQAGPQRKASPEKVSKHLAELLAGRSLPSGILEQQLAVLLSISTRTAKEYAEEWLVPGAGYIKDSTGRPYSLSKAPEGRTMLYSLKPVFE